MPNHDVDAFANVLCPANDFRILGIHYTFHKILWVGFEGGDLDGDGEGGDGDGDGEGEGYLLEVLDF